MQKAIEQVHLRVGATYRFVRTNLTRNFKVILLNQVTENFILYLINPHKIVYSQTTAVLNTCCASK
jgi:hypothetical protein